MNLFKKENIILHSGQQSNFKIDCDALTDEDIDCIAYLISEKIKFCNVIGVPTGGIRLQNALHQYIDLSARNTLICDDVLTTGNSMEEKRELLGLKNIVGIVIFARGECPFWITPIFTFNLK